MIDIQMVGCYEAGGGDNGFRVNRSCLGRSRKRDALNFVFVLVFGVLGLASGEAVDVDV